MNLSSEHIVLPATHRRQFLTPNRSSTLIDTCPIAVSNKIKAIQARKTRLNALTTTSGYTDIRPINFGCTNSRGNLTVWTAERLVDRSKDIRLDRIPSRQPARRSVLSTTSTNQHSLFWPHYQSSHVGNKQPQAHSNSTPTPPPAIVSIKNKPAGDRVPQIIQGRTRPPLFDRQNSLMPPVQPQKSLENIFPNSQTEDEEEEEDDDNELVMDKEFEEYYDQAIIKCANWLLKYVFNENKT